MINFRGFAGRVLLTCCIGGGLWAGNLQGQSLADALKYLEASRFQDQIANPYQASAARAQQITSEMGNLRLGQSPEQVRALMGAPDDIEAIFVAGDRTEEIAGFEYLYLLERRPSEWSGEEFDQRCLKLSFDLSGALLSVEGTKMDGFNDLTRELGLGFAFSMGIHETVRIDELLLKLESVELQPGDASEKSYSAKFSVHLSENKENLLLQFSTPAKPGEDSRAYSRYKITLLGVENSDRVTLIVE